MKTECVHCGAAIEFDPDDRGLESTCAACGGAVMLIEGLHQAKPPVMPTPAIKKGVLTVILDAMEKLVRVCAGILVDLSKLAFLLSGILLIIMAIATALGGSWPAAFFMLALGGVIVIVQAIHSNRRHQQ